MKSYQKSFALLIAMLWGTSAYTQTAPVPDTKFLTYLQKSYPATLSGKTIIIAEAKKITGTINCSGLSISNLEGIQYYTGISSLDADDNTLTSTPDLSTLVNLVTLNMSNDGLTTLPDISTLTKLKVLIINNNKIQSIPDLTKNSALTQLVAINNNISVLHGISKLTKLSKIDLNKNKLTELPDLSSLINLESLDVSQNLLDVVPDISKNKRLTDVSLQQNFLQTGINVTGLDSLETVQLQNNLLSFADVISYTSYPNYRTVFTIAPQKLFPGDTISVGAGATLLLQSLIDRGVPGTSYEWSLNGTVVKAVVNDSLQIPSMQAANAGKYTCRISNTSFPGYFLRTDTFFVNVVNCTAIPDTSYKVLSGINCMSAGVLEIANTNAASKLFDYVLTGLVSGQKLKSINSKFNGLTEPAYILSIKSSACKNEYALNIKIPFDECLEVFITPNNDGDKDQYYFSRNGKVNIYDKAGTIVNTISTPAIWDGSSKTGKFVTPGYYLAEVNGGEEYIMISVIY